MNQFFLYAKYQIRSTGIRRTICPIYALYGPCLHSVPNSAINSSLTFNYLFLPPPPPPPPICTLFIPHAFTIYSVPSSATNSGTFTHSFFLPPQKLTFICTFFFAHSSAINSSPAFNHLFGTHFLIRSARYFFSLPSIRAFPYSALSQLLLSSLAPSISLLGPVAVCSISPFLLLRLSSPP